MLAVLPGSMILAKIWYEHNIPGSVTPEDTVFIRSSHPSICLSIHPKIYLANASQDDE
jgi:hypothetical protein